MDSIEDFHRRLIQQQGFRVSITVDYEDGQYVARARVDGFEDPFNLFAKATAPDAASALQGAMSALGQTIAREELAARFRMDHEEPPE